MKIQIIDDVLTYADLNMDKEYEVLRTETVGEHVFYVVLNENGDEYGVEHKLAKEL